MDDLLIEKLAALEHEQWQSWRRSIESRYKGISALLVPKSKYTNVAYADLPEEIKEEDRKWARKALELMKEEQKHA